MNFDRTTSVALRTRSRALLHAFAIASLCIPAGANGADDKAKADAAAEQRDRQREAIAKNYEANFQPFLRLELDYARTFCGDLPATARRRIVADGREAVRRAADDIARAQVDPQPVRRAQPVGPWSHGLADAGRRVHEAVEAAVKAHAPPDARAAYEREQELRVQRERRRDCLQVMALVAPHLDLTAEQRSAIRAALEERWDPSWTTSLFGLSHAMPDSDGRPQPPLFAASAIEPHLDSAQRTAWRQWANDARKSQVGSWSAFRTNQGIMSRQQDDPWWNP